MIQFYFNECQKNPQIQETLDTVKEFKETKEKIINVCFLYIFYKEIIEKENFQYYDLRNTPSMEKLKEKMTRLDTIPKENLVFHGRISHVLHELQEHLNDYFKRTLPLAKRCVENPDHDISKEINQTSTKG